MYYEINVSKLVKKKGGDAFRHFFATHSRSITTELQLREVLKVFMEKFPAPEYNVIATLYETHGTVLPLSSFKLDREKIKLKIGYFLYANKGDTIKDNIHISGKDNKTLCGKSMMVAPNWAKEYEEHGIDNAGCDKCITLYRKIQTDGSNN
jgi:hypothetical protein